MDPIPAELYEFFHRGRLALGLLKRREVESVSSRRLIGQISQACTPMAKDFWIS